MNSSETFPVQGSLWPNPLGVHFSSARDDHRTPPWFLAFVRRTFNVTEFQDVACDEENAVSPHRWTVSEDSLTKDWAGCGRACWLNPPYGEKIGPFVEKACLSAKDGATVYGLLPARTDTAWFHNWVFQQSELHFIKGRLQFSDCAHSAPFPSVLTVWRPGLKGVHDAPLMKQLILPHL